MVSTETLALNSLFRKMRNFLEGEDLLSSVTCIVDYDYNRIIVQPHKQNKDWPQQDANVGVVDEVSKLCFYTKQSASATVVVWWIELFLE